MSTNDSMKNIKTHVQAVLKGGDILFIAPPFADTAYSLLGPHILQALAHKMGYKADILYSNILFASLIGEKMYNDVSQFPFNLHWLKIGERLFSRSAYGLPALGTIEDMQSSSGINIADNGTSSLADYFNLDDLFSLEQKCSEFIEELVRVIAEYNYAMVGCTSMLEQNNCSVALLNGIKKLQPDVVTMIGGANCEGVMAEGIASLSESIDYIFSGESEQTFNQFLTGYEKGIFPEERIIRGDALHNLDGIPVPDYSSYFTQMEYFFGNDTGKQLIVSYESSRGCWRAQKGKCFFCGGNTNNRIFRKKSAEKVLADLEEISNSYPVTNIFMTDNIVPRFYYQKLLPVLSERDDMPPIWYQENTNLTLTDLINLKKARIKSLLFGVEALSTDLLKLMNKGVTARQNLLLLRNALSVGIHHCWHMLWGFPGDKCAHYEETLALFPLIRHFYPPRELLHLILARYSSYVESPHNHAITNLAPLDVYHKIYPSWAQSDKLAYGFTGDYDCESHDNPDIIRRIAKEIEVWNENWKNSILVMLPVGNFYSIHDSRKIPGTAENHIVDAEQAKAVMTYSPYDGSEYQQWAVENKLGVVCDSYYVPLITASPKLLLKFEEK